MSKTKALISCTVTAQLICVFVFAYAKKHKNGFLTPRLIMFCHVKNILYFVVFPDTHYYACKQKHSTFVFFKINFIAKLLKMFVITKCNMYAMTRNWSNQYPSPSPQKKQQQYTKPNKTTTTTATANRETTKITNCQNKEKISDRQFLPVKSANIGKQENPLIFMLSKHF